MHKKYIANEILTLQKEMFASYEELELKFLIEVEKIIWSCDLNGLILSMLVKQGVVEH